MVRRSIQFEEGNLGMVLGCRESDGKAVVVTVQEGGAAKRGGARQGMILVRINDDEANGFDQVVELLQKAARPMTIAFDDEKRPPPPPPRQRPQGAVLSTEESGVASRWAAMKADHQSHSEKALGAVRDAIRADVEQHDLDSLVAERVKYFSNLFKKALNDAFDDSRALDERDPNLARRERARRRKLITEFEASDRIAKRAPQPSFENVAGSPDELIIQLSPPEGSEQVLYALVDVSQIDNATARKWIRYLEPLKITTPGKYVVLSKTVVYEPYCCESRVATAVYELGPSPPLMQYEGCPRELAYVADNANKNLVCVKCGRSDRKLYARGDYCICRDCALKGAGVMIDPGARRMWFSQMISFVGGKAIPLPRSQPLLAQILRVMQLHPGMTVRFEGHVNSYCSTSCDGTTPCDSVMCKGVPGGAMGLSTARASALKSFLVACGIEDDRVYAVGFAGTRRLTGDVINEATGHLNRRVEVHTLLC